MGGLLKKLKKKVKHAKPPSITTVITTILPVPPIPIVEIIHHIPPVKIPPPKEIKNTLVSNLHATGNFIQKASGDIWDTLDMDSGGKSKHKNKDNDSFHVETTNNEINPIWYVGTAVVIAGILFM